MGKRILYIFFGDIEQAYGLTKKIKGLISEFQKKDLDWNLFALSSKVDEVGFRTENEYLLPFKYKKDKAKLFAELDKFLNNNEDYEICYFRYPGANKELVDFLKKHPNKIIFEHNTKEVPELANKGKIWVKKYPFRLSPSYFKLIMNSYYKPLNIESRFGKKALELAKKGVAVTDEIARYEESRSPKYKCSVISNGIAVDKVPFKQREFKKGDTLNILLLVAHDVDWHGVDIILESFAKYKNDNIKIFFVGKFEEQQKRLAEKNKNVLLKGYLSAKEFDDCLRNSHVGLGSFALFRKELEEASTLKVREYLASGLPVFFGHKDTDIEASESLNFFCLDIDVRKQEINWDNVYSWAVNLYKEENLNQKIRDEAKKQIDFSKKAKEILEL